MPQYNGACLYILFWLVSFFFFSFFKLACKKDLINSSDPTEKRSRDVPGNGREEKGSGLYTHTGSPPSVLLFPATACLADVQALAQMLGSPCGSEERRRSRGPVCFCHYCPCSGMWESAQDWAPRI